MLLLLPPQGYLFLVAPHAPRPPPPPLRLVLPLPCYPPARLPLSGYPLCFLDHPSLDSRWPCRIPFLRCRQQYIVNVREACRASGGTWPYSTPSPRATPQVHPRLARLLRGPS